jgi:hypothetical protein
MAASVHDVTEGTVEEWELVTNVHPFHPHVNHIQAMDSRDGWTHRGDWLDTFVGNGRFRVRGVRCCIAFERASE